MVSDTTALSVVTEGNNGVLAGLFSKKIYVDMCTVSPASVPDVLGRVAALRASMLDVLVMSSARSVEGKTLACFVGRVSRAPMPISTCAGRLPYRERDGGLLNGKAVI